MQQSIFMTNFYTATGNELQIPLMKGISDELMQVNTRDDRKRWWEVIDAPQGKWYPQINGNTMRRPAVSASTIQNRSMNIQSAFLAYIIWDPVHMYNAVTNGWKDFEHQITFDVRQPKNT